MKIAINGFGRIGRLVLRALLENQKSYPNIDIVAINDINDIESRAHLFQYDSTHGVFNGDISINNDICTINGNAIKMITYPKTEDLPWADLGVDIILECTGRLTSKEKALGHIDAGAKKVIVSAPASGADATIVYGVNHHILKKDDIVISNASCTTNCLAPVAKILHENFAIENGFMTTIHAYTSDQQLLDGPHKDMQRARSACLSMIPSSTGAAKAIGLVLPDLDGRLDGTAIRVPTPNVSCVNLVVNVKQSVTVEKVNSALEKAANGDLKHVFGVNSKPLVSVDFNHCPLSSVLDLHETYVTNGNMVRVLSWYDNEWGFANRMIDLTQLCADI